MRVPVVTREKSDENSFDPWPPGKYDFHVFDASEETSAAGNEMIKLTIYVFNNEKKRTVFDYLLSGEKHAWKVRHFADAVGMTAQYESGNMECVDIAGRSGLLSLRVKAAQGDYPAGNQVGDYLVTEAGAKSQRRLPMAEGRPAVQGKQSGSSTGSIMDDEVPFGPCWQ